MKRLLLVMGLALISFGCSFAGEEHVVDDSVSESEADALTTFTRAQKHNLAVINLYRASGGLSPLRLSPALSTFADAGSARLSVDHVPHAHFISAGVAKWQQGFRGNAAENQGDIYGWPELSPDPEENETAQIDAAMKAMFDEGPGEGHEHGHYENLMNPRLERVGIGIRTINGRMYLTNDFSE